MRGVVVETKTERKSHSSIAMKKPILQIQTPRERGMSKQEKEKIIILMIIDALREYYKLKEEGSEICYETPGNSMTNGEVNSEDSTVSFAELYEFVLHFIDEENWSSHESLFEYVKHLIFHIKSHQIEL